MKTKFRRFSKRSLSMVLAILVMASVIGFGSLITVSANTSHTVYFTPYHDNNSGGGWIKDNKTIGARFCLSNNENYWLSATGSDTGRTQGGQRVYQVTVEEKYGGLDHLYFRNDNLETNTTNQMHAISSWGNGSSDWSGKYYNGSSWVTKSYDTFKIRNNGSNFATLSYSSGGVYSTTASLTAGTTYKFTVYDGTNYWANSGAGTITGTDTKTMYRYNSGGSSDCITMTPTVSGTYTFKWTLNGAGSREDAGDLKITYPTTYTVTYNKGSNGSGTNTTDTKVKDVTLTLKDAIFTRTGYTQTAWNTNSSGTGGTSYALSGSYTANSAVTLYPTWTAKTYTITYKDQGDVAFSGTHASGAPTSHTYGTATTLKSASKDGYTFGGWFTTSACTGSAVTSLGATAYTSNITLYAKWTLKTYTITLSESGATGGTLKVDNAAFTSGSTVTHGSHSFRVDAPSGYKITSISGIGTWTNNNTYATLGSTSITANKTISVTYAVLGTCGFELSSSSASINIGATTSFTATPNSYHSSGTISVSSSNTSIATVSKSGNTYTVTAVAPGTANITVSCTDSGSVPAVFVVTVNTPTISVENKTGLKIGESYTPSPTLTNPSSTGSGWTVVYSRTSGTYSTTDGSTITGDTYNSNATTFKASFRYNGSEKASTTFTVKTADPTISFNSTAQTLNVGGTVTKTATGGNIGSGATGTITYSSSDTAVATVNSSGKVTALTPGSTTITATYTVKIGTTVKATKTASYTVSVNTPTITMSGQTVAKGDSVTFSATTTNPSSGLNITYSLQSPVSGVSITSAGVVTVDAGCSASSATVVATAKNSSGTEVATQTATLTIQAPTVTIADIANNSTQYLALGTNITNKTLTTNFSNPSYTKTSSNSSVATASITSGKLTVTSVAKGKATITVTATKGSTISVTQTFTVKVSEAETYKYLYFTNGVSWSGVNAYFYGDGENASFPGESMTKIATNENSQKVYAIRYPATKNYTNVIISDSSNSSNRVNIGGTTDIALSSSHNAIWCNTANTNDGTNAANWYDCTISRPQISADDIADLPINTSTSLTADVLTNTTPSKFKWSSASTSTATVGNNGDTGATNYNTITGVYPGTTTITITAYSPVPTNWTLVTDGTADTYVAGTATASVTVTATPKTVTWGTKVSTDNGSTYSTNSSAGTVTVTNGPSSSGGTVAHGTQVTFSASTNSGYKFAGWQVDGNNTITTTTSKTVTVNANTTVYALYYKTYTVTLTAGTGFTSSGKKYRIGSSGSYSTYSSALTVNQGAEVYFQVAYSTGYEYNGVTNATVATANTVFKTAAISGDLTVTITAKKKTYPLTGVVSPAHGTVTFYSNSTCTTSINSATYNTAFYAKYTPADGYSLNSFTTSDASISATSGNVATCKVTSTYANKTSVTITANVALEHTVTYYVDMHSDSVVNTIALYSNSNASTALQYNNNGTLTNCSATPTKQGSSTVYAADIKTPLTSSGVGFSPIYVKITYTLEGASSSEYKIVTLSSANLVSINNSADKSVWLEAASDSPQDLSISYATNSTSTVASGYQRIYLKKPYSWQNTTEGQKWTNIGVYYWGDNPTDIGWANDNSGDYRVVKMKYLGYDSNGSDGYHYYYADIPIKITQNSTDYTVKNIIFQGWGTNTSLGGDSNKILAKTENIMNFTKNYFKLDNSNNEIQGVPELSSAMVPAYTRYASGVTVQKGENQTINIKPTTSNTVTFSSGTPSVATVSASGVVTPVKKGSTTITVTVYGTVGYLVRNNEQTDLDRRRYTLTVTVKDPSVVSGFNIMSLATATKTITIPTVSGSQPGYFDSAPTVTVTGTPNAPSAGYTSSAIVTATETTSVSGVGTKPITYTVKYAAPNNTFTGYSGITVTATEIVSMSIRFNDANRYGYKHWTVDGVQDTAIIATKKVEGGIETATTKDVTLDGTTYNEVFEAYTYVDVTFNFDYYEYETERTVQKLDDDGNPIPLKDGSGNIIEGQFETEQKQFYQYDKSWIGNNDNRAQADAEKASGLIHYDYKTYTVTDFEVRGFNSGGVTAASIYEYAQAAIGNKPNNNYYNYTIDESTIKSISKPSAYKATVKVEMTHTPKTYKVYIGTSRQQGGSGANGNYYYQEYANLSTGTSYNWILTDSTGNLNGPTLFTGKTYKFRVTGDTYLKRTTGTIADDDFNRSRVALTNQGVSYEPKSTSDPTIVEKLTNDFYIADFFDPAKVLNDRGLQEDDVKFVGGGVLYYQVKDGVPAQKAVDGGYVDSSTGVADSEAVSEFIKEKIEAGLENPSIVPADIEGTDDRMAVAYGTKINAQKDSNTDLFIRYLPNEVFRRTSGGALETETVEGVTSYTMATDRSADTYRYSNSLKAYQYIYASTMENRAANYGKNMRLYAYYIYSYTAYDEDTGIPETVYNVVLSDQPANATTYFNANN